MGFLDTSNDPSLPVFYNVVHAVGAQCPNPRDDVKLVQYLLLAFYDKAQPVNPIYTRPQGNMTVDGSCGPITRNWILKFQLDVNKRYPGSVATDDRVDRARNKDMKGAISGTLYTIGVLNQFVKKVNMEAYIALPGLVPLDNSGSVPPPSWDTVQETSITPDEQGGF